MSDSPLPSLDPALREHLNQFGEMMMNQFNDWVDRLIERLTSTPQENNTGVINRTTPGGAEGQGGNQLPNGGVANPVGQHPNQLQFGPQPLQGEGEITPQGAPQAIPPPPIPPVVEQTPQPVSNMQGRANPHTPPVIPNQVFEGQASYQPPGRYRPQILGDNNAEHSFPWRILDFDADSDDDSPLAANIMNAPKS